MNDAGELSMANTYFITGGAGNVARQLAGQFVAAGHRTVLVDIVEPPEVDRIFGCETLRADLTEPEQIDSALGRFRPDTIIHLASLLSGKCELDRAHAWRVNVTGSFELFEAALRHDVRTFFFTSTAATYGGDLPEQLPGDQPQWPQGIYGVGKVAVERLGNYYHSRHGLDFRSIRLPIVISRYAHSGASSAYASMAFIESVSSGTYTFRVHPQTRVASVYILDALAAIRGILDAPAAALTRRVYNIQSVSPSAQEIADAITASCDEYRFEFNPDPELCRLVDSWPQSFDDRAARSDWNWSPKYDLDALARHFIEELRSESADARRLPAAGR